MKLPNLSNEQKRKLVVKLSWWILEQKLFYYNPQFGTCVSDEKYDAEEHLYKKACSDLGIEPTASNNVGFPWDTPSGRLVAGRFSGGIKDKWDNNAKPEFDTELNGKITIEFEKEYENFIKEISSRKRKRPIN